MGGLAEVAAVELADASLGAGVVLGRPTYALRRRGHPPHPSRLGKTLCCCCGHLAVDPLRLVHHDLGYEQLIQYYSRTC